MVFEDTKVGGGLCGAVVDCGAAGDAGPQRLAGRGPVQNALAKRPMQRISIVHISTNRRRRGDLGQMSMHVVLISTRTLVAR